MSDSLVIFGQTYTDVPSILAKSTGGTMLQYIRPQGSKTINQNGTGIDVAAYETVDVNVSGGGGEPSLQAKSVSYTPTASAQSETVTADSGYDGLSAVSVAVAAIPSQYIVPTGSKTISANGSGIDVAQYATVNVSVPSDMPDTQSKTVTPSESQQTVEPDAGKLLSSVIVNAISSTYVGTGIARKSSSDLTASGATVSVPAGYYQSAASKVVTTGSATAPATISGTAATLSTGTNTLTLSKSVSVTPSVTAGYISSGTAGNANVSLTASVTTKAAATINTSTTDQTIASGQYLTGTQTIKAVTVSGLAASNILSGVTVKVGDANDDDRIASVTGNVVIQHYYTGSSTPSSSLGDNGDIYLQIGG